MDHVEMLERRLEQMEIELTGMRRRSARTSRRSRLLTGCVVVVAIAGALTLGTASAATGPTTLTVKAPFQVVDGSGNVVMLVKASGVFFKSDGKTVAALGGGSDGGIICTYGTNGSTNGCLSSMTDGGSQLKVGLPGSGSYIQVGGGAGDTGGNMGLRAYKNQKEMAFVGTVATGGETALYKVGGASPSTVLGAGPAGGYLQIQDQKGTPHSVLADHNGGGFFILANSQGVTRVQAMVTTEDAGLVRVYGPSKFDFLTGS
jgi:hypothetical protein